MTSARSARSPSAAGVAVHELRGKDADLEALFFQLTEAPENANRNLTTTEGVA